MEFGVSNGLLSMNKQGGSMNKLILYPTEADFHIAHQPAFIETLRQMGFIGDLFTQRKRGGYLVGSNFFSLITFLGCLPFVPIEPTNEGEFCYIDISPIQKEAQFLASSRLREVRCPKCRNEEKNWQQVVAQWIEDKKNFKYECPKCGHYAPITRLNWKRKAAITRWAIEVHGIYESEAVPNDSLLQALKQQTDVVWDYCYQSEENKS